MTMRSKSIPTKRASLVSLVKVQEGSELVLQIPTLMNGTHVLLMEEGGTRRIIIHDIVERDPLLETKGRLVYDGQGNYISLLYSEYGVGWVVTRDWLEPGFKKVRGRAE